MNITLDQLKEIAKAGYRDSRGHLAIRKMEELGIIEK